MILLMRDVKKNLQFQLFGYSSMTEKRKRLYLKESHIIVSLFQNNVPSPLLSIEVSLAASSERYCIFLVSYWANSKLISGGMRSIVFWDGCFWLRVIPFKTSGLVTDWSEIGASFVCKGSFVSKFSAEYVRIRELWNKFAN